VTIHQNVTTGTIAEFAREALPDCPQPRALSVIRSRARLWPAAWRRAMADAGIPHAAGTGKLITGLITGRSPSIALEASSLSRFAGGASGDTTLPSTSGAI
jgi:hypothetical protein